MWTYAIFFALFSWLIAWLSSQIIRILEVKKNKNYFTLEFIIQNILFFLGIYIYYIFFKNIFLDLNIFWDFKLWWFWIYFIMNTFWFIIYNISYKLITWKNLLEPEQDLEEKNNISKN